VSPVVVLDRVSARDAAAERGRSRGALSQVSLALGGGVHAVLGAPEDGTIALLEVLTGARRPVRGNVRVGGLDPARHAAVRARIGALNVAPRLPPAANVGAVVRLSMRARGEPGNRFDGVIDPFGLEALHARGLGGLAYAEARAVELALALSTPAPLLLALHEPFADVAIPRPALVRQRIRDLGHAGVCVVVATSSAADARSLGGALHVLRRGLVTREEDGDAGPGGGGPIELLVWVRSSTAGPRAAPNPGLLRSVAAAGPPAPSSDDGAPPSAPAPLRPGVRELAAALSLRPEVRGITWERPPREGEPAALRVRGDDANACALALIDTALDTGVEIETVTPAAPGDAGTEAP
jgi:ABC-2 type transport system ATP-binding protein